MNTLYSKTTALFLLFSPFIMKSDTGGHLIKITINGLREGNNCISTCLKKKNKISNKQGSIN